MVRQLTGLLYARRSGPPSAHRDGVHLSFMILGICFGSQRPNKPPAGDQIKRGLAAFLLKQRHRDTTTSAFMAAKVRRELNTSFKPGHALVLDEIRRATQRSTPAQPTDLPSVAAQNWPPGPR